MNGYNSIQKTYFSRRIGRAHIQVHIFPVSKLGVEPSKTLQEITPEHTDIHLCCHNINGEAIRPAEFVKLIVCLRSAPQTQTQGRLPMLSHALAVKPGLLVSEQEVELRTTLEGSCRPA